MKCIFKRITLLLLLTSLILCLSGCGGSDNEEVVTTPEVTQPPIEETPEVIESGIETAVQGRRIVMAPNDVLFWGYGPYLCSALVDESGNPYDTVIEAQFRTDIQSLAIHEGWLYIGSNDGLFRYELAKFAEGNVEPQQVTDREIDYGFQIYGDTAYYEYGYTAFCAPITGGDEGEAAHNMDEFTVTSEGIYFSGHGGGLYLLSLDGAQQNRLTQTPEYCKFCVVNGDIYFRCEKNDQISHYDSADGSITLVNKMNSLSDYSCIWANEDYLLFETADYDEYVYSFSDGSETPVSGNGSYPDIEDGFLYGNRLYSLNYDGDAISVYDLASAQCTITDVESILEGFINGQQQQPTASAGEFDICANMGLGTYSEDYDILMCDHFTLKMPTNISWYTEQVNNTTVIFIYHNAYMNGYGGKFLTLRAYDYGDESYKDLPSWAFAGQNSEKVFIAIYPTDLQYDPSIAWQAEDYTQLLDHVMTIGNLNTPFEILD